MPRCGNRIQNLWIDLLGFNSRLALKAEGLARVSKNAGGRPRLASVAFDESCISSRSFRSVGGHTFRHHITSASLFRRLGILDIDSYFHNRILRWAGHVARMPMSRAPRQLLTGWVSHSRPIGCPQMTWGRTLEIALKSKGISKDFDE